MVLGHETGCTQCIANELFALASLFDFFVLGSIVVVVVMSRCPFCEFNLVATDLSFVFYSTRALPQLCRVTCPVSNQTSKQSTFVSLTRTLTRKKGGRSEWVTKNSLKIILVSYCLAIGFHLVTRANVPEK